MLETSGRTVYGEDHDQFRASVRRFLELEFAPHIDRWEAEGCVDRSFWRAAGHAGFLCPQVPADFGGLGLDFSFNAVINEELSYAGCTDNLTLQSDITVGYLIRYGTEAQKRQWLPKMVAGEVVTAIAMTEPSAGSDLQGVKTTARRDGDSYIVNGSKTYITNGQNADLVIVVAKTQPELGAKGTSLILVEAERAGFARGRNLDKIGQHSSDTSELFFEDVRVPVENLLGEENRGFVHLVSELPQERLSISISAQAAAQRAFDEAVKFTKDRTAFGKPIGAFEGVSFKIARMATDLDAARLAFERAIALAPRQAGLPQPA